MSVQKPRSTPSPQPAQAPRAFAARGQKQGATLSHERIAADIAAFRKAGGKVEVLGTTQVLKAATPADAAAVPRPASAPRARR